MAKLVRKKVSTRYCACPDDAEKDCRFHPPGEPGWEKCPYEHYPNGRWLWSTCYVNVETDEVVDKPTKDDEIVTPEELEKEVEEVVNEVSEVTGTED